VSDSLAGEAGWPRCSLIAAGDPEADPTGSPKPYAKRGGKALARHAPHILKMGRERLAARRDRHPGKQSVEEHGDEPTCRRDHS